MARKDKQHVPSTLFYFQYYGLNMEEYVFGVRAKVGRDYNLRLMSTANRVFVRTKKPALKVVLEIFPTNNRPISMRLDAEPETIEDAAVMSIHALRVAGINL